MKAFISNIKQAILSRGFLIAAGGVWLVLLLSNFEKLVWFFRRSGLHSFGYHTELVIEALRGDFMSLVLPLAAALPYAAAVLEDTKSGYIRMYLPRTTRSGYLFGRIFGCALSGALAPAVGALAAWGTLALLFLPREEASAEALTSAAEVLKQVLLCAASGALWALVGMAFANFTRSRWMAYAAPFVVCYVLMILAERYFGGIYVLYPREWLVPSAIWPLGEWGALLFVAELALLAAFTAALGAKRRLARI